MTARNAALEPWWHQYSEADEQSALDALERVVAEEFVDAADSNRKQQELRELVKKAAMLHDQAGDLEAAQNILVRGRCYAEAADVALRLEQYARAAELFVEARDAPRAAARALGTDGEIVAHWPRRAGHGDRG